MPADNPTYDFWARYWFCHEQKVHVVNEYDREYGDEGTTTITRGHYCPRCYLAICHVCSQLYESRIRSRSEDKCPIFPPARGSALMRAK